MAIIAQPLNFVDVNNFTLADRLELIQGNGGTYYFQLFKTGTAIVPAPAGGPFAIFSQAQVVSAPTRYIPAVGATVTVVFPRTLSIQPTPINQDVSIVATPDPRDASIYSIVITAANTNTIVSEGVRLSIVESGVTTIWPVDHFVRRRSNAPGA